MCLIFTNQPSNVALSDAWLTDFYERNQDGWGFMWFDANTGTVQTHKALGTCAQWIADFRMMETLGVEFATHLRMRTHGATDLINVHPYPVIDNFEIMHNGILASGYGAGGDMTKSDTWHYIVDTLRPLIEAIGTHATTTQPVLDLIGNSIGNNRFVMVTPKGDMKFVNAHQGKMWFGRWMSNTYAWSADLKQQPSEGPAPVSTCKGKWSGKGFDRQSGWSMGEGVYDMYDDAFYDGGLDYSKYGTGSNVAHLADKKPIDTTVAYVPDLTDLDADEAALVLAEAADAQALANAEASLTDAEVKWVDVLDLIEETYDLATAQTVDLIAQEMGEYYTTEERATTDVEWLDVAKWAWSSEANALGELLSDFREGYSLTSALELAIYAPVGR